MSRYIRVNISNLDCKDIPGFEGKYAVTRKGEVYSYYHRCLLRPILNFRGYLKVNLVTEPRRYKSKFIHRLVAETYLDKPDTDNVTVNHKDGDKQNNHVENLEWCTDTENRRHARRLQHLEEQEKEWRATAEALLSCGARPEEIAARLGLDEQKVRTYLQDGEYYKAPVITAVGL